MRAQQAVLKTRASFREVYHCCFDFPKIEDEVSCKTCFSMFNVIVSYI